MGKGGEQQQAQAALPRGVVTHSYGTDAADTVSSKGARSGPASWNLFCLLRPHGWSAALLLLRSL